LGQETVISPRKSATRRIVASCRSLTSDPWLGSSAKKEKWRRRCPAVRAG